MDAVVHLVAALVRALRQAGLWWGIAISIGAAVGSLVAVVAIVVSWPVDLFKSTRVIGARPGQSAAARVAIVIAKNLAGVVLVILGLIMAIPGVPGQGLLTAVIGLTLINFPGKRRIEGRLIRQPRLLGGINRLRARFDRPPLELD